MAEQPSTRKVQITVPTVDTSVIEWLTLQYSASESVRRLIRESIAREGFVDVANRPVRPPANPVYVAEELPPEDSAQLPVDEAEESSAEEAPVAKEIPVEETPRLKTPPAKTAPAKTSPAQTDNSAASATIDDLLGL